MHAADVVARLGRELPGKLGLEPGQEGGPQLASRIGKELAGWREVSRVFGFRLEE